MESEPATHPAPSHPAPSHPVGRSPIPAQGGSSPQTGAGTPGQTSGSPSGWLARRREARARKRIGAGRQRIVHRVEMLGDNWHIVDYHIEDPDFLAIGPGGIFQVTVGDHGRNKVELAGDVVQVNGHRYPYVALARRDAKRISEQMSAVAGRRIPVVPVVAFLGSGQIAYYGRPPEGCVVTSYRDVGRALNAHGVRITPATIQKLVAVAQRVDRGTIGQFLDISS